MGILFGLLSLLNGAAWAGGGYILPGQTSTTGGGTGTSTTFTSGSVVFSTTSGVYSQDNANFFYKFSGGPQLGIGTASPGKTLTIGGSSNGEMSFLDNTSTARGFVGTPTWSSSYVAVQNASITESAGNLGFAQDSTGNTILNAASGQFLSFRNNNQTGMTMDLNRNVGINTTTPGSKLHLSSGTLTIDGNANQGLVVTSAGNTGVLISGILSATGVFNPGSIAANTCTDSANITVTGAVDGNECWVGAPNANASVAGISHVCYVSGAGTIKVRACCDTVAACVATSQTYRVTTLVH